MRLMILGQTFFYCATWLASFNPLTAKLFNLNFHPLKVVSRWRDPQLQVSENYSDLTIWRSTFFKYCWLMSHFMFNMFKRWYLIMLMWLNLGELNFSMKTVALRSNGFFPNVLVRSFWFVWIYMLLCYWSTTTRNSILSALGPFYTSESDEFKDGPRAERIEKLLSSWEKTLLKSCIYNIIEILSWLWSAKIKSVTVYSKSKQLLFFCFAGKYDQTIWVMKLIFKVVN